MEACVSIIKRRCGFVILHIRKSESVLVQKKQKKQIQLHFLLFFCKQKRRKVIFFVQHFKFFFKIRVSAFLMTFIWRWTLANLYILILCARLLMSPLPLLHLPPSPPIISHPLPPRSTLPSYLLLLLLPGPLISGLACFYL